jgi:hypothetical protein
MTSAKGLRAYLDEEVARIAKLEGRPVAQTERLLLLHGIRKYDPRKPLRLDVPPKVIERIEALGAAAGEARPEVEKPTLGEGRVLEFAPARAEE